MDFMASMQPMEPMQLIDAYGPILFPANAMVDGGDVGMRGCSDGPLTGSIRKDAPNKLWSFRDD